MAANTVGWSSRANGLAPLHPAVVTDTLEQIAYFAGLPPIRLHDLRHFAATLPITTSIVHSICGRSVHIPELRYSASRRPRYSA